jgi:hypothetical protein
VRRAVFILAATMTCTLAGEKQRDWRQCVLLSDQLAERYAGSVGNSTGTIDSSTGQLQTRSTGSSQAR